MTYTVLVDPELRFAGTARTDGPVHVTPFTEMQRAVKNRDYAVLTVCGERFDAAWMGKTKVDGVLCESCAKLAVTREV